MINITPRKESAWRGLLALALLVVFLSSCKEDVPPPPPAPPNTTPEVVEPPKPTGTYDHQQIINPGEEKVLGQVVPIEAVIKPVDASMVLVVSEHSFENLHRFMEKYFPNHEVKLTSGGKGISVTPLDDSPDAVRVDIVQSPGKRNYQLIYELVKPPVIYEEGGGDEEPIEDDEFGVPRLD